MRHTIDLGFYYRSNGRANFTGEVNRNFSEQAGEVFNRTLQNGTLGDLEVDPFILTYVEHQSGKISKPVSSLKHPQCFRHPYKTDQRIAIFLSMFSIIQIHNLNVPILFSTYNFIS